MRLRLAISACAVVAVLAFDHLPSHHTVSTAAAVQTSAVATSHTWTPSVPTTDQAAWSELAHQLELRQAADVKAWTDGFAAAEAQKQADAEATARRVAAAKGPAAPGTATGPSPTEPSAGSGDPESAVREFFGDIFSQAWGVSGCESGHDPGAISTGGGNWGLFQINRVHKIDFEQFTGQPWSTGVLNARFNAMYARKLYNGSGWGPWSCAWAAR